MVCVSFYVICIVELLVSSVICRFQGLSYSHVPECIEFSFILFIHHNIHFYFELCTYCNILDIYLSWNMNSVKYLFYMELLNYLFCDMFGGILECYELTHVLPYPDPTRQSCMSGQALLPHWLCNQKHPCGICSCSPIVNFLSYILSWNGYFSHISHKKNNLNRHIKHENLLSIYEIWIIFKSCCSLWHVENFRKYSNHILKDIFMWFSVPILWKYC